MQVLVCHECEATWEREPKRGRKPKVCPDCKDAPNNSPTPPSKPKKPKPKGKATPKQSKWSFERTKTIDELPFLDRPGGWCTDYDPAPKAQHDKCPYDLYSHRCPCDCHKGS